MANDSARELANRLHVPALSSAKALNDLIADAERGAADEHQARFVAESIRSDVMRMLRTEVDGVPGLGAMLETLAANADGWHPTASIGPVAVSVDCAPATVDINGKPVVIGLLPPTGAQLKLDAGLAKGGGSVNLLPNGFTASLAINLGVIHVMGFAKLDVNADGPSLIIVLGARFTPPLQLSFGFMLSGVGGVIGVNRLIDTDAMRRRLSDGSALDALFPENPVSGAARVLAALGDIFGSKPGQHVVGPTLMLAWLDLGPAGSLISLDLGLLLEIPAARLVLIGRGKINLAPFLALRLDVLGDIDPMHQRVSVDAVLVDSRALGIFVVTGSAALRFSWGKPPYVLAACGGFFPGYRPEPVPVPPQQRLALALDVPCPLRFRAEGYLAITSGAFQLGAKVDVGIDLSVISAHGFLNFDANAQLDPFHLHVNYRAGWKVSMGPFSGGTTVSGWIDGPGPWKIHAAVSIDLLLDDLNWSDTFIFGAAGPGGPPPLDQLVKLISPTLSDPSHIRASKAHDPLVLPAATPPAVEENSTLASPLATLSWTQSLVPLDLAINRAAGRTLASRQALHVVISAGDTPVSTSDELDWFAPGTYLDISQSEAMNLPSFERLKAGSALQVPVESGAEAAGNLEFKVFRRRAINDWLPAGDLTHFAHPSGLLSALAAIGDAPVVGNRAALVSISDERWTTVSSGATDAVMQPSAAHALVSSRITGSVLQAAADTPLFVGAINE